MPEPLVFVQGRIVGRTEALVSAFDAGLIHGVGLFETMIARRTSSGVRVFRLEEHLDRLAASSAELGLSHDVRTGPLADAVRLTAERSGYDLARVRLTLTGGDLNLLETSARSNVTPTVIVSVQPATQYPDAMFERGVMATLGDARLNPLDPMAGHKTLNYWARLRELQKAAGKGAGESILLQVTNHVAGGCVSNLFAVRNGSLHTPIAHGEEERGGMPSPVLPGITRAAIIEIAQRQGIGTMKRMLTIDDVLDADELFLTNSSWGVLPVVRVEAEEIGDGTPGEMTRELRISLEEATKRP
ncbi:MAG: aminotransferase class IV [Phycisphaerales bacterium]|nr:aminotransferase class IV [Phycisphaerales bacterium]